MTELAQVDSVSARRREIFTRKKKRRLSIVGGWLSGGIVRVLYRREGMFVGKFCGLFRSG